VLRGDDQMEFSAFEPEDFDAYLPEKWNSNMFTLQRRKVKSKLETIGLCLKEELEAADLSLVLHLSDEFPSLWNKKSVDTQWLFFSRDEAARAELTDLIDRERTLADTLADPTPRYRHVFLGVAVKSDLLEIGLRLHYDAWVDRQNLINLLKKADGRLRLIELFGRLPEHYEVTLNEAGPISPPGMKDGDIESLASAFAEENGWLFIGARLPRDQVSVLGSEMVDTAREVFCFLIPVYRFFAWSQDNDAISLDRLVAEHNEALRVNREEFDRERARREEERREKEKEGLKLREEIEEKCRETKAWRQREFAAKRAAAARAVGAAKQEEARARAEALAAKWDLGKGAAEAATSERGKTEPRTPHQDGGADRGSAAHRSEEHHPNKQRPRTEQTRDDYAKARQPKVTPERASEICVGDMVEVRKGFLKGRRGIVNELDEKGGVKVNFGALSSRLALNDVSGLGPASALTRSSGSRQKKERGDQNTTGRRFRGRAGEKESGSSQQ
jgi:hypothetical protein